MTLALMVKFRPVGPWRSGPDSGARERADLVYHSDSLYSAVCGAMSSLGHLDEWLDATARDPVAPAVRFSSCFPFQGSTRYVAPPRSVWPPPVSAKVRWNGARFVPVDLVDAMLCGDAVSEDRWAVDGPSECLLHPGQRGPFRHIVRSGAAVDRWSGASEPHLTAGMEFAPGAGLWAVASFRSDEARGQWVERVKAAVRLLADSGLGGQRSRGWGRSEAPEFTEGTLASLLIPRAAAQSPEAGSAFWPAPAAEQPYWLLSLFAPGQADQVAWDRGQYSLTTRGGRIDSPAGPGQLKKRLHMVTEGSVLVASGGVNGAATDVAPDGFPHPVYRAGFAVAVPIPTQVPS